MLGSPLVGWLPPLLLRALCSMSKLHSSLWVLLGCAVVAPSWLLGVKHCLYCSGAPSIQIAINLPSFVSILPIASTSLQKRAIHALLSVFGAPLASSFLVALVHATHGT